MVVAVGVIVGGGNVTAGKQHHCLVAVDRLWHGDGDGVVRIIGGGQDHPVTVHLGALGLATLLVEDRPEGGGAEEEDPLLVIPFDDPRHVQAHRLGRPGFDVDHLAPADIAMHLDTVARDDPRDPLTPQICKGEAAKGGVDACGLLDDREVESEAGPFIAVGFEEVGRIAAVGYPPLIDGGKLIVHRLDLLGPWHKSVVCSVHRSAGQSW